SNYTSTSLSGLLLHEAYPSGFIELGQEPAYSSLRTWSVPLIPSGQTLFFTVWGVQNGLNNQVAVNRVEAWQGPGFLGSAEASVKIRRPETPELSIRSVYPNPAPSGKAG